MNAKYKMNREQCVFWAKKYIAEFIWKMARVEGLAVTLPQTELIVNAGRTADLDVDTVVSVNNMKHAWGFILNNPDLKLNFNLLCEINRIIGANLIYNSGFPRNIPVRISGTRWVPPIPIEADIREELSGIMTRGSAVDKAIKLMLWCMRRQMFNDGNKRTAQIAANLMMINGGGGIIAVPDEKRERFSELLVAFYETNDIKEVADFVYGECIDGTDFP